MARRLYRKLAVLAKVETEYGTSANPTGAANAMLMTEVSIVPLAGEEVSRDLYRPFLGNQGVILVGNHVTFEGSVEIAGAGAAGTAPAYGPLLRGCGLSETITAATNVVYQPVSSGFEAVTLWVNLDGVNHALLGARGNVTLSLTPKQIPHFKFSFTGLLGPIADTALPAAVYTGFKTPVEVSKANTTLSIHGYSAPGESLSIDLGNKVEPRFLIGAESIEIVDRRGTGTAVLEAAGLAAINWFDRAANRTRGALSAIHGTAPGNIVEISADAVEVGRPAYGQTQSITNVSLPLMLNSVATDDDIKITVR